MCKASGGLGLELTYCPLFCILLAKASYEFSPDSKDGEKDSGSRGKLLQYHFAKDVDTGDHKLGPLR